MVGSAIVDHLDRQNKLGKQLYADRGLKAPPQNLTRSLKNDRKRAKETTDAAELALLEKKYLEAMPKAVELKRILSDALYKFLHWYKHGTSALYYDRNAGAPMLEQMWNETIGNDYARPTKESLDKYIRQYESKKSLYAQESPGKRPLLINEAISVCIQLREVLEPVSPEESNSLTSSEADAIYTSRIAAIWDSWHRTREDLVAPHIDSFNFFAEEGLQSIVSEINHMKETLMFPLPKEGDMLELYIDPESVVINRPPNTPQDTRTKRLSYNGQVTTKAICKVTLDGKQYELNVGEWLKTQNGAKVMNFNRYLVSQQFHSGLNEEQLEEPQWTDAAFPFPLGQVPVMVRSSSCHLHNLTPEEMIAHEEDEEEAGGYFIANGNERILRLMATSRANYAHALQRPSFARRSELLSDKAVIVRSQVKSGVAFANTMTYESTGVALLTFTRGRNWLLPVAQLMMALKPVTFYDLYQYFLGVGPEHEGSILSTVARERASNNVRIVWKMQKELADESGNVNWMAFMGSYYNNNNLSKRWLPSDKLSDEEVGEYVIRRHVLPHLNDDTPLTVGGHQAEKERKFDFLVHMLHKLFQFQDNLIGTDSADATCHQSTVTCSDIMAAAVYQGLTRHYRELRAGCRKHMENVQEAKEIFGKAEAPVEGNHEAKLRFLTEMMAKLCTGKRNIFAACQMLVNTGNFVSGDNRAFAVMQPTGWSVVAERINMYRLLSQLRGLHRGSQVQEMRSSVARKLPLEGWGFLCPVETPDGSPCGVLNHISGPCRITPAPKDKDMDMDIVMQAIVQRGVIPIEHVVPEHIRTMCPVVMNGQIIAYLPPSALDEGPDNIAVWLRTLKSKKIAEAEGLLPLPQFLEIGAVPKTPPPKSANDEMDTKAIPFFPGLFLFTDPGRMMRPVRSLMTGEVEYIGTLEQVFLHIACTGIDIERVANPKDKVLFRHIETSPSAILSFVSSTIPFFGHNPSPRNLFQCQMAKQTMGVTTISRRQRYDNKIYDLRTPQRPLVRTEHHWGWNMDSHPITTNAVVAIISYSEYDMEDAVVINKSALERGMFEGDTYKSFVVDLNSEYRAANPAWDPATATTFRCFRRQQAGADEAKENDVTDGNGLPKRGAELRSGVTYYQSADCHFMLDMDAYAKANQDITSGLNQVGSKDMDVDGDEDEDGPLIDSNLLRTGPNQRDYVNFKPGIWTKKERCFVEEVTPIETTPEGDILKVIMRCKIVRDPVLGDKFSSRHGQKGTCSLFLPQVDMPFSDTGIVPDVLINPHAFPSRMTVGMMLELLAGKLVGLTGRFLCHEATAWNQLNTDVNIHDVIGEQLAKQGFDYFGEETMYSGQTGDVLTCRIFTGMCAYQRLRHMVMDKWQAREKTGPIDVTTLQPVKGRKRGGGVKVGEMERDVLLSHGAVNLTMDRLFSSGLQFLPICTQCGSFLTMNRSASNVDANMQSEWRKEDGEVVEVIRCTQCQSNDYRMVGLPFAFIYLCFELLAMNIEVCLTLGESSKGAVQV